MNYDRNDVVVAFRARNPDNNNPSETTLAKFDQQLFLRFGSEIRSQAPGVGIPLTPFNESKLALFAFFSSGTTPALQVRRACIYFDSVRPQPLFAAPVLGNTLAVPVDGSEDERNALLAELGDRPEDEDDDLAPREGASRAAATTKRPRTRTPRKS